MKKWADDVSWEEFLELRHARLSESRQDEVIVIDDESEPIAEQEEEVKKIEEGEPNASEGPNMGRVVRKMFLRHAGSVPAKAFSQIRNS